MILWASAAAFIVLLVANSNSNWNSDRFSSFVALFFMFVGCVWAFYWVGYSSFVKSVKWLKRNGMEHIADDIVLDTPVFPKSKTYCGQKAFFSKKSGVILPYAEIVWSHVYVHHTARVFEKTLILHTKDGAEFSLDIERDEFLRLLRQYILKHSPDIILGFGAEQELQYRQMYPQPVNKGKKVKKIWGIVLMFLGSMSFISLFVNFESIQTTIPMALFTAGLLIFGVALYRKGKS